MKNVKKSENKLKFENVLSISILSITHDVN